MNNLKEYIIEKLKIDKSIKLNKLNDFYADLNSYLKDKEYFGYNEEEFSVSEDKKYDSYSKITLHLPKNFKQDYKIKISDDIDKLYKNKKAFHNLGTISRGLKPEIEFTVYTYD